MSISDVRRAFQEAVAGVASCELASMDYEEGGKFQVLHFRVRPTGGETVVLSERVPARTILTDAARAIGEKYASTLPSVAEPQRVELKESAGKVEVVERQAKQDSKEG